MNGVYCSTILGFVFLQHQESSALPMVPKVSNVCPMLNFQSISTEEVHILVEVNIGCQNMCCLKNIS